MKTSLFDKCLAYNFEKLFKKLGYAYFTKGSYNLNIIGIRSEHKNNVTNRFDDCLIVTYNTANSTCKQVYTITTEPGLYYMTKQLLSPKGTAILVPGQYRGCWELGKHNGRYKALIQKKPVKVYRDNNKDLIYDMEPETIQNGVFGINIHRSSEWFESKKIDKYSAGCQVFANPKEFTAFMRICEQQARIYGNSFTYTLINEKDLDYGQI